MRTIKRAGCSSPGPSPNKIFPSVFTFSLHKLESLIGTPKQTYDTGVQRRGPAYIFGRAHTSLRRPSAVSIQDGSAVPSAVVCTITGARWPSPGKCQSLSAPGGSAVSDVDQLILYRGLFDGNNSSVDID
ncbi:hypothetical protein EVAR_36026_1 [Eumeta japonica]|uniref:Uncharacterized protein n=1 Tax=Eumeta variegata TaxID=151549 RepID=A0A4C1WU25_EUMVA|nr:hypothetical protein EVAR_36026_1 [Eumeta japonica]